MTSIQYIRDGRASIHEKESTSCVMSANKRRDTTPEILLRKAMWKYGIRGYRLDWKKVPGRPDIAFSKRKKAIFVHRCSKCDLSLPKSNTVFWKEKFKRNKKRDKRKVRELHLIG
ncbi:MAG: very short patch repair endonuclease [Patescibacteria group bacterium]|nr:very short patch repair endonuclease [Patescibacteria group bacterium]